MLEGGEASSPTAQVKFARQTQAALEGQQSCPGCSLSAKAPAPQLGGLACSPEASRAAGVEPPALPVLPLMERSLGGRQARSLPRLCQARLSKQHFINTRLKMESTQLSISPHPDLATVSERQWSPQPGCWAQDLSVIDSKNVGKSVNCPCGCVSKDKGEDHAQPTATPGN